MATLAIEGQSDDGGDRSCQGPSLVLTLTVLGRGVGPLVAVRCTLKPRASRVHLPCYSHWRSFTSISSSSVSRVTTSTTQATRRLLTLALSKNTCHAAALFPQHGFSQADLRAQSIEAV